MKKTQRGIWESKISDLDLEKPAVLKFYVERKINAGDWSALDRQTIASVLPQLKINPYLRRILENFVYENSQTIPTRSALRGWSK